LEFSLQLSDLAAFDPVVDEDEEASFAGALLLVFAVFSVFFSVVPDFSAVSDFPALSGFSVFSLLSPFAPALSLEESSIDPPESLSAGA
jgi:hypothetical protein